MQGAECWVENGGAGVGGRAVHGRLQGSMHDEECEGEEVWEDWRRLAELG